MEISVISAGAYQTNTYIITEGAEAVIVDPVDGRATLKRLGEGIVPVAVLLTHGHFDHIAGVAALQKAGAKVYIAKSDKEMIDALASRSEYRYIEPFVPDVYVEDGMELDLIGHTFKVIAVPGHTPGSVCYISEDIIFSGDTLFYGSVGRTDLPFGDGASLGRSLKKLLALPAECTVLPGHGPQTDIAFERKYNPYV